MSSFEENLERENKLPSFYRRYVDDTLTIMPNIETASNSLDTPNKAHPSVKFTMKTECNGMLPFLGILLLMYVKPTNSGPLLHYQSRVDSRYKKGLLRTMLDRAHRLSLSWPHFFRRMWSFEDGTFSRLNYPWPEHLVNSTIESFVDSKVCNQQQLLSPSKGTNDTVIEVILPFKDQTSTDTARK